MNKFYVVIGDWSGDGHDRSEKFLFMSNKTVEEMQQAYKDSCKLTGIQFNHNENYTDHKNGYGNWWQVCTEYEDGTIKKDALEVLKEHGCKPELFMDSYDDDDDDDDFTYLDPEGIARLIVWFIGLSLPDDYYWEFNETKDDIPCLNGYLNKDLNVQFGYGLYN